MKPEDSMRTSSLGIKTIKCESAWMQTKRTQVLGFMMRHYRLQRRYCMPLLYEPLTPDSMHTS